MRDVVWAHAGGHEAQLAQCRDECGNRRWSNPSVDHQIEIVADAPRRAVRLQGPSARQSLSSQPVTVGKIAQHACEVVVLSISVPGGTSAAVGSQVSIHHSGLSWPQIVDNIEDNIGAEGSDVDH